MLVADVASTATSASAGRPRAAAWPRQWTSRCGSGRTRSTSAVGAELGVVARVAAHDRRLAEVRGGGAALGELRRRTRRTRRCWLRSVDQPERGDVPEHGRAAVAEQDLLAVGQREQLGEPVAHARRPSCTGAWRWRRAEESCRAAASAATASGRTLEGPQPNRPSAGSRSAGIVISGVGGGAHRPCPADDRRARPRRIPWRASRPASGSPDRERTVRRVAAIAESATLAVDAKAKALKAAGEPVIGFGAGEPDFPTPAAHRRGRGRGLPRPEEPPLHAGRRPARAAGRRSPPRRSATPASTCTASQVLVTNGGKHAVYNTFAALLDPGDEVLLPGARTGPPTPSRSPSPAACPW